jgi:SP family facilitated glucose transporter-like MFS transporter 8
MTAVGASLMDKSGRRPLLMIAAGGMGISCFIVGLSFYIQGHFDESSLLQLARILSLIGLLGYISTFSIGMGGIPWVIMSEIFPLNMKRIAGSLVSLTAWLGSWIVTLTFNYLFSWSDAACFFIFCVVCAFTVLFVVKLVPETKGRTLEEIQSSFS